MRFSKGDPGHVDEHNLLAEHLLDPSRFGAKGDGTADDSHAIQAALDAAGEVQGWVTLKPCTYRAEGLTIPTGVTLGTPAGRHGYIAGSTPVRGATIQALNGGDAEAVITFPVETKCAALVGVNIQGKSRVNGVEIYGKANTVRHVHTAWTSGPGIRTHPGTIRCVIENTLVLAPNVVTPEHPTGGLHLAGTDHHVCDVEVAGNPFPARTEAGNNVCVLVEGWHNALVSVIGELGDTGILVTGALNKFSACRADLNYGHGWVVTGSRNSFSACGSVGNSKGLDGEYDGWHVTNTRNGFAACHSVVPVGYPEAHRWAFYDSTTPNGNGWAACMFDGSPGFGGAAFA